MVKLQSLDEIIARLLAIDGTSKFQRGGTVWWRRFVKDGRIDALFDTTRLIWNPKELAGSGIQPFVEIRNTENPGYVES